MFFHNLASTLFWSAQTVSGVGMGWYLVRLDDGNPTKGEALFTAAGTLSLHSPAGAISVGSNEVLVQASSQEDAVRATIQGTITATDSSANTKSFTFPSDAFDVGHSDELFRRHRKFDINQVGILVVLEDTTQFAGNSWGTDHDYDDFHWHVDVTEVDVSANVDQMTLFTWGRNDFLVTVNPPAVAPYVILDIKDPTVATFSDLTTEKVVSSPSERVEVWGGQVNTSGSMPGSSSVWARISDTSSGIARKLRRGNNNIKRQLQVDDGKRLLQLGSKDLVPYLDKTWEWTGEQAKDGAESGGSTWAEKGREFLDSEITLRLGTTINEDEINHLNQMRFHLPQFGVDFGPILEWQLSDFGERLSNTRLSLNPDIEPLLRDFMRPLNGPADGITGDELDRDDDIGFNYEFHVDWAQGTFTLDDIKERPGILINRIELRAGFLANPPYDDTLELRPYATFGDTKRFDDLDFGARFIWRPKFAIPFLGITKENFGLEAYLDTDGSYGGGFRITF